LDSCDALVGVDWVKSWEKPTVGEIGVDGELVAGVFPDFDGLDKGIFVGMLCVFPMLNGSGGKSIVVQIAFLMLGEVLGFSESGHVCGEDSAVRIA